MSQGCNVIVDDLGYYGEPFFADGPIALAAQNAVNSGVVYVSAAGNESTPIGGLGDFHYDHQFVDDGSISHLNNFNPGGTTDDFMDFNVLAGGSVEVVLQWSDPFGASANDYDLRLYAQNHTTILENSDDTQNGSQDPVEAVEYVNPSATASTKVAIRIQKFRGASRELEMFVLGDAQPLEYVTPAGSIIGQTAAPGVMAIGAIDAADPGTDTVEYYSSQGPRTIYTNFALQTKTTRNVLAGVAIDGVQTHIGQLGDFENPFYGTSAAAPHAAAIAALLLDANPSLSPASVNSIMQNTAVDLTSYGAGYDQVSGSGRFDALDAVFEAFTPTQAPDMTAASDSGISSTDNLTDDNTPTFTGTVPAGSFVTLYVDGVANASQQLSNGASTYTITTTPLADGTHSVTIRLASSNATPAANFSPASTPLAIVIDRTPPTITPIGFDFQTGYSISYSISENLTGTLQANDLRVDDSSGGAEPENNDTGIQIATAPGPVLARFTFTGLASVVLPDGNYSATLDVDGLTDAAGNRLVAPAAINFFILTGDANHDRTVNALDFNALASNFGAARGTVQPGRF